MQKYTVIAPMGARFHPPARLAMNPDQARRRAHAITETDEPGVFEVHTTVMFKVGEEVGVAGDVNKALLAEIAQSDTVVAREVKERRANANAAAKRKTAEREHDALTDQERRAKAKAKGTGKGKRAKAEGGGGK